MKNIYKFILVSLTFLFIFSCESKLEEVLPEDQLATSAVFSSFPTINGAVVGMYSLNQSGDLNGMLQLTQDFMADDVNFVGSFPSLQEINQYSTLATNASIDNIWFDAYQVIGAANNIIKNLPSVDANSIDDLTDDLKSQFIAEAKFLRALTNFQLVNIFAHPFQFSEGSNLGIPLVLEPFEGGDISEFQLERSTVNEVHNQIMLDLTEASADLPESNGVRASSAAAKALLARIYLYRENWPMAASMANDVLNLSSVAISTDYNFYNDVNTSSELIFTVINSPSDGPQETTGSDEVYTSFYNAPPGGRGDAPFSQSLINAFSSETDFASDIEEDFRFRNLSASGNDAGGNSTFFTTKYSDIVNNASNGMVLRATEMVLIRAEANFRDGTEIGNTPLDDINDLRDRANLLALTTINLDAIFNERRKEMCFEGHRRMDLLRNNRNLRPDNGAVSAPGADKVIFPIVDDEIDNNPNISQNPSY